MDTRITFRLDEADALWLGILAADRTSTVAAEIRRAVTRHIESERAARAAQREGAPNV